MGDAIPEQSFFYTEKQLLVMKEMILTNKTEKIEDLLVGEEGDKS